MMSCERSITRTELYIADEIFVTGTAAEITPIISVDNHKSWKRNSWRILQEKSLTTTKK